MSEGCAERSEQAYAENVERGVGCVNRGDSKTGKEKTVCKPKQSGGTERFTCQVSECAGKLHAGNVRCGNPVNLQEFAIDPKTKIPEEVEQVVRRVQANPQAFERDRAGSDCDVEELVRWINGSTGKPNINTTQPSNPNQSEGATRSGGGTRRDLCRVSRCNGDMYAVYDRSGNPVSLPQHAKKPIEKTEAEVEEFVCRVRANPQAYMRDRARAYNIIMNRQPPKI